MPAAKKIRKKHVALVLAVLVVAGAAALLSSGSSEDHYAHDRVTGELSVLHGETLPIGTPGNELVDLGYVVKTDDDEVVPVELADPGENSHAHHILGATVEVVGDFEGETLVADEVTVIAPPENLVPALPAPVMKKVAVLLVNFTNDTRQTESVAQINDTMFTCNDPTYGLCSVNGFYQAMSDGNTTLSGDVFGWYTMPMTNAGCNTSSIRSNAKTAATQAGVNLALYQYVVYYFPSTQQCPFAGLASLPGTDSWINGTNFASIPAHELGHNFGVHHSSSWRCTAPDGTPVTLSQSCIHSEYGDPFSDMGSGASSFFDNWHRWVLGFLPDVQTVTASGTYQLGTANNPPGVAPRALRIARPDGTSFWLEFDQAEPTWNRYPAGSPILTGVTVHVAPTSNTSQTHLIDTTPATMTWWDAALQVGQTFTDQYPPATNVQITTLATGPNGATVSIQFAGVPPTTTTVPPTTVPPTTVPPTTVPPTTVPPTTVPPTTVPPTTVPPTTVPPPPGTITEKYDVGDDSNGDGAWASFKLGQSFVATSSHLVTRAEVNAFVKGKATPVTCELFNAPAGLPSGAALASASLQEVSVTPGWRSCVFPNINSASLVAGNRYVLVLRSAGGNGSNAVYWRLDSSSPTYIDGNVLRSRSSGAWDNTSPNPARDHMFRIYAS